MRARIRKKSEAPLTGFKIDAPQNTSGGRPVLLILQDICKFKLEEVNLHTG